MSDLDHFMIAAQHLAELAAALSAEEWSGEPASESRVYATEHGVKWT